MKTNGIDEVRSQKLIIGHEHSSANMIVTGIPTEIESQRLLICLESTLKKINLIQIIPHLCARILAGDDPDLERILGSVCVKTILKLFFTQMAWFKSDKEAQNEQVTTETGLRLSGDIKTSLTLSSEIESASSSSKCSLGDEDWHASSFTLSRWGSSEEATEYASISTTRKEGQLVIYDEFMLEPSFKVLSKDDVKQLYREIVHQLELNTLLESWIENYITETGYVKHFKDVMQSDRRLSASFSGFQVSIGFHEFKTCIQTLYDLMRSRLLCTFEESINAFKRSREYWIRERVYGKEVARLVDKLQRLQLKWKTKKREYDAEIEHLQATHTEMIEAGFQQSRDVVMELEVTNLITKKSEELKQAQRHAAMVELKKQNQLNLEMQQKKEVVELKQKKQILEDRLSTIIAAYDSKLMERQTHLDALEDQERKNEVKIKSLYKMVEDTQEQFEEMRNTKKLKEILRNIAMADDFRENRAARIIQMAWRKYKYRKLRKLKRKGRFKRKPKPEEIWKELGYMTYCTPQDHVRALQKKKVPAEKEKKKKSKKPFKIHTGSSFRSRQSSSISLFLL